MREGDISTRYDARILRLSPLVIRNVAGRTDEGTIIHEPELQFQIKNLSRKKIEDLEAEITYYGPDDKFLGTDLDLRLEPLLPGDTHNMSFFIETPGTMQRAELKISGKPQTLRDHVRRFLGNPFVLVGLVLVGVWFCETSSK